MNGNILLSEDERKIIKTKVAKIGELVNWPNQKKTLDLLFYQKFGHLVEQKMTEFEEQKQLFKDFLENEFFVRTNNKTIGGDKPMLQISTPKTNAFRRPVALLNQQIQSLKCLAICSDSENEDFGEEKAVERNAKNTVATKLRNVNIFDDSMSENDESYRTGKGKEGQLEEATSISDDSGRVIEEIKFATPENHQNIIDFACEEDISVGIVQETRDELVEIDSTVSPARDSHQSQSPPPNDPRNSSMTHKAFSIQQKAVAIQQKLQQMIAQNKAVSSKTLQKSVAGSILSPKLHAGLSSSKLQSVLSFKVQVVSSSKVQAGSSSSKLYADSSSKLYACSSSKAQVDSFKAVLPKTPAVQQQQNFQKKTPVMQAATNVPVATSTKKKTPAVCATLTPSKASNAAQRQKDAILQSKAEKAKRDREKRQKRVEQRLALKEQQEKERQEEAARREATVREYIAESKRQLALEKKAKGGLMGVPLKTPTKTPLKPAPKTPAKFQQKATVQNPKVKCKSPVNESKGPTKIPFLTKQTSKALSKPAPVASEQNNSLNYDMTHEKLLQPSTEHCYNIDDFSSSDETDEEEKPRKTVPEWATKENMLKFLSNPVISEMLESERVKRYFGYIRQPVVEELFEGSRKQYSPRNSSAIWSSPLACPKTGKPIEEVSASKCNN